MNDTILIILMLLGFAAGAFVMWIWCSVAKDPDEHENTDYAEFIDTVELEGGDNPMFKDQAS